MKIISKSLSDTQKIAKDFIEKLSNEAQSGALVVGLYGDLGSGKTTFTQEIAKLFNIKEDVTSPTFVIEKIYKLDGKNNFKNLIHIDAYRLDSGKDLASLGFSEILKVSGNLVVIEWPERVMDILPKNLYHIDLKFISETEREINL